MRPLREALRLRFFWTSPLMSLVDLASALVSSASAASLDSTVFVRSEISAIFERSSSDSF